MMGQNKDNAAKINIIKLTGRSKKIVSSPINSALRKLVSAKNPKINPKITGAVGKS